MMRELRFLVRTAFTRSVRRLWGPALIVLAGLLAGLGYGLVKPPTYTATAFVLVVGQPDAGPTSVNYAQAYARLAPMAETLAWSAMGMPPAVRERARRSIQASSSPDTPMVRLTGSSGSPVRAAEFANTAADALVRYGNAHQQDTGVRVALMTEAETPVVPSSPNLPLNVAVGTATGLLLGGLVAVTGLGARVRRFRAYVREQVELQEQAEHACVETPLEERVEGRVGERVGEQRLDEQRADEQHVSIHAEAPK